MLATGIRVPLPQGSEHLVPGAPEHALAQEALDHHPSQSGLSARAASGVRSTRGGRAGARCAAATLAAARSLQRHTQPAATALRNYGNNPSVYFMQVCLQRVEFPSYC